MDVHALQDVAHENTAEPARPSLRIADLELARACLQRDPNAIARFEAQCFPEVERALLRMKIPPALSDDIKAKLRERLFFPRAEQKSPLVSYSGRGSLKKWLRAVAVRDALAALRANKGAASCEDEVQSLVAAAADPELSYLKATFASAFKSAMREAMESLTVRERNLLRQHVLDGLNVDKLGAIYGVHRATAARWVVDARHRLLTDVRQRLMTSLQLSEDGFHSAVRMARSQLDVSVERLLGQPAIG